MSTAGKKRGRPPKGKASEQEEERNEEVITPQRMSLTVRTYKSPKSSQESASPSSQSKSKSPAKASSKHSKNSSPPPPSPIRTPPRTVSPSTGSKRVGRRKSLEAKNKPREEPISPSMPPPPPEEPATSEAILPPKEMEELKKQFEDIDKYELVEETVHVPPKVNKYDEQTGNSASNKGAVTNKTPKGSLKKSNKHTDEDGYESPYSPPHANTPRVLITPKSLVKTPSSRPTSAYSTPASHSKPKPILPPTPNSSIPTPTKHTPKPKPLIPTSPASSSSSKPKPATSSAKKHATSPAKPAPVQAESETETETETNSKPVAKKVGAKKAGRPKKETQDAKPKKETEDPKPKKGAAKTKKETEDAKPKKETNAKKVAGRKRAVEESDDDQLRRSKRLQK
eukprot:Phypoly_transcript_10156.p1 GENE.Phypoly_transcript_10156~~Phypoly_transcript_10156.p1  ORF type:complete len:397 (-),score=116.45 Phypoly_transcript_10156:8-1198(-)